VCSALLVLIILAFFFLTVTDSEAEKILLGSIVQEEGRKLIPKHE